ncbi:subclass B1 metallo-beta-lactamase FIM-1 [Pseudomonas aeruginosa]|uniref:beta-lactamase n=1 Tax=Pseudomonas aeruginosa TaxID=287 RepID=K7SA42_PSEAI|nr:subclass B1 metallo-beta-lactamase FIM-1 [Pseudomonas aeruginosa]AFV91534.1 metallo-beta-lactamase FIM-1 [Pseudomonas aeruginosa]MDV2819161.1 subclass B1 metallo-beta-lactamase FIM-1 [Pseudomonas aeruginosa]WQH70487.1 subclass B1 metallo-beta-lactamase FIM-1 [Pseudomonas aeruginosa]WQH76997.1 subclass B1 metallo-beta-lactamase FIM-1 [Pseudomonas aeruginosa]
MRPLPHSYLKSLVICLLTAFAALTPVVNSGVQAAQPKDVPVTFTAITQGVWMHTSMKHMENWGHVPSNGLIVEKGDFSILVDTAWDDPQTAQIIEWSKDTLKKPIRWAVFTHAHDDKMGGVAALRQQGIVTYAAADSNRMAPQNGLTPAEHDLIFDSEHSTSVLHPLVIFDPGPGHTRDNIVVGLPEQGIVFGGCLIRPSGSTSLGNTADADLAHWKTAVLAVAQRFAEAQQIIPSHGPMAGRELFELTAQLAEKASIPSTP